MKKLVVREIKIFFLLFFSYINVMSVGKNFSLIKNLQVHIQIKQKKAILSQ